MIFVASLPRARARARGCSISRVFVESRARPLSLSLSLFLALISVERRHESDTTRSKLRCWRPGAIPRSLRRFSSRSIRFHETCISPKREPVEGATGSAGLPVASPNNRSAFDQVVIRVARSRNLSVSRYSHSRSLVFSLSLSLSLSFLPLFSLREALAHRELSVRLRNISARDPERERERGRCELLEA